VRFRQEIQEMLRKIKSILKSAVLALAGTAFFVSAEPQKRIVLAEHPFDVLLKKEIFQISCDEAAETRYFLVSTLPQDTLPVLSLAAGPVPENCEGAPFLAAGQVVIVPQESRLKELSAADFQKLLRNELIGWSCVCAVEGVLDAAKLRTKKMPRFLTASDASAAAQLVRETPNAIGILPLAAAVQQFKGVRVVKIEGVLPTPETVFGGKYPGSKIYTLSVRRDAPESIQNLYRKLMRPENTFQMLQRGWLRVPQNP